MKKIIYLSLLFILCNSSTCNKDKCHKTIAFVNNTSKDVYTYVCVRCYDTLEFYNQFPYPILKEHMFKVKSGEKSIDGLWRRSCYEHYITQEKGGTIVYVFDAEVLETVTWDTIEKYYMVLKTIRPTLEEMERSNWTIYFTGE